MRNLYPALQRFDVDKEHHTIGVKCVVTCEQLDLILCHRSGIVTPDLELSTRTIEENHKSAVIAVVKSGQVCLTA